MEPYEQSQPTSKKESSNNQTKTPKLLVHDQKAKIAPLINLQKLSPMVTSGRNFYNNPKNALTPHNVHMDKQSIGVSDPNRPIRIEPRGGRSQSVLRSTANQSFSHINQTMLKARQ